MVISQLINFIEKFDENDALLFCVDSYDEIPSHLKTIRVNI